MFILLSFPKTINFFFVYRYILIAIDEIYKSRDPAQPFVTHKYSTNKNLSKFFSQKNDNKSFEEQTSQRYDFPILKQWGKLGKT